MKVKLIPVSYVEVGMYIEQGHGWLPVTHTSESDTWCDIRASDGMRLYPPGTHVLVGVKDTACGYMFCANSFCVFDDGHKGPHRDSDGEEAI